jgi:hypothetical protein
MKMLLDQFKALTDDEKLAFMKEAMADMAEIFQNDPQKMMTEMMPVCMNMMKSKGMNMNMDMMRVMMKTMMGNPV